jgi:hypothetical protein
MGFWVFSATDENVRRGGVTPPLPLHMQIFPTPYFTRIVAP